MKSDAVSQTVDAPAFDSLSTSPERLADASGFGYLKRRMSNILVLAAGDALALSLSIALADRLYVWFRGAEDLLPNWWWLLIVAWWLGSIAMNTLPGWGLGAVEELRRYVVMVACLFALMAISLFVAKAGADVSRMMMTSAVLCSAPLLLTFRIAAKTWLIRRGWWGLPTVVYGNSGTARLTLQALQEDQGLGLVPIGIFCEDAQPGADTVEGVPVLGGFDESSGAAPAAVVALDDLPRRRLIALLEGPLSRYRRVVLVPDLLEAPSLWVTPRDIGGILGLEVSHNLLDPLARVTKRATDLALVVGTAPVWIPLFLLIFIGIWTQDRTPPIFSQERVGWRRRTFHTLKFRTMVPHAEQVLKEALARDPSLRAEWDAHCKLQRDPRVTRLGALLRRTSLDELPQLINVLLGHMSLVGPRPLPRYHDQQLPEALRKLRLRVRPGVTGLWQVCGRSEIGNAGMVRWDSYYVRNWSIWLDIVILVRTVRAVLRRRGAY